MTVGILSRMQTNSFSRLQSPSLTVDFEVMVWTNSPASHFRHRISMGCLSGLLFIRPVPIYSYKWYTLQPRIYISYLASKPILCLSMSSPYHHFVPGFGPQPLTSQVGFTEANGFEKPPNPGFDQERPVHARYEINATDDRFAVNGRRSFLRNLVGWPILIILGQLALQSGAWIFIAAIHKRGFIALPYLIANWVKSNGHEVTAVFTLLSTALAACSSFLFSWTVRQSIALRLYDDGMSLAVFVSTLKLSSQSPIFDAKKRKLSAMSMLLFVLTSLQAPGWSGLLTPQVLEIRTPLVGSELDLSSPILSQMLDDGTLDYCVKDTSDLFTFAPGQTESGFAAARNSAINVSTSLTLMDQSFSVSTGGILPQTFEDVDAKSWFPGRASIPGTLSTFVDFSNVLSANYSLFQQGFSADVTCQFESLTSATSPSLFFDSPDTVEDWSNGDNPGEVSYFFMSSDCTAPPSPSNVTSTFAFTVGHANLILMVACGGSPNYTLIFKGTGSYDFVNTTVCNFSPKITNASVQYLDDDSLSGTIKATSLPGGDIPDSGGPAGLSAIITLSEMLIFAQAVFSNTMGDELKSILEEASSNDIALTTMQDYIRGVAEYSGSVLRACLSAGDAGLSDGMTIPTQGSLSIQIVGWRSSVITILVLIPGTIVALATIYVALVCAAHHTVHALGEAFDPESAMHLLSASAAGDLNTVFTSTDPAHLKAVESVSIGLENISGKGPALKVRRTAV
ncbi:hypothetical protein B0H19DRAFT_1160141 [Mycena capillaripes]|nr:hypothetical protein B0H19DRAFT_1160141 [Mycena capillaripes]